MVEHKIRKRRKERLEYIERLKSEDKFLALHILRYTQCRTWNIQWLLLAIFSFLVAVVAKSSPYEFPDLLIIGLLFWGSLSAIISVQLVYKSKKYAGFAEEAFDHRGDN